MAAATPGATAVDTAVDTAAATDGDAVGPTAAATAESIADPTAGATAVSSGSATAGATAEPLLLVKRQAPEAEPSGCVLYRYGSFSTELNIVREHRAEGLGGGGSGGFSLHVTPRPLTEGIESVAIVQVLPAEPEGSANSVELTVTCEGR